MSAPTLQATESGPCPSGLATAARALRAGHPVLLARSDGAADLLACSPFASVTSMSFLIRHGSGLVQVVLPEESCDRLRLPAVGHRSGSRVPRQRVAVDAASGITTGISAADRRRTAQLLADPDCEYDDLVRPGHVMPIGAPGDTATDPDGCALALCSLAAPATTAITCGLVCVSDPRRMVSSADEAEAFARAHELHLVPADALAGWPLRADGQPNEESLTA